MTILISADWHLSDNSRDKYRFIAMRTIRQIIKDENVDLLIMLGDVCESKNNHSSELVNAVVTEFYKFAKLCPVIVLKANHDYEAIDAPFWAFLRHIPRISYITTPTDGKNLPLPPHLKWGKVLWLPHTPNYKKDWANLDLSAYDLVFAHQTFAGALNEAGHRMDGVPLDIFSPWTVIVSGDIHAPQDLGQLTYVGAPYTVDFGDNYEPRVLLIEDKKGGPLKGIPIEGVQKRLLDAGDDWKAKLKQFNKGDLVKVRFPFKPGGEHPWAQIKEEIHAWGAKFELQIEKIEPIIEKGKSRKVKDRTPKSDQELLRAYATHRRINERILKTGLWLLERS